MMASKTKANNVPLQIRQLSSQLFETVHLTFHSLIGPDGELMLCKREPMFLITVKRTKNYKRIALNGIASVVARVCDPRFHIKP
jgi:hypothetical protein